LVVNISYIESDKTLKDNMWITAEPRYKNTDIEFSSLYRMVSSDKRQYSPYCYTASKKCSEQWNNDKQNVLIFDIDDGMTMEEATKVFSKYTYLLTTTKKHRTENYGDRFRIVLPAKNIPRGELYFKMLEIMAEQIPMDIQVNSRTGAFLGNKKAINIYNDGLVYDCIPAVEMAENRLFQELKLKKQKDNDRIEANTNYSDIKSTKERVDFEVTKDVLTDLGYEFRGNKFRLREEDRTPSAMVYSNGYIIDYGGDFKGDIFDVLYQYHDMNFKKSLNFVNSYIRMMNG